MRVLLIADVHANGESLLALQRAERQPDALLFAGDAVGYGPQPADCLRWLIGHATVCIMGNHDRALATGELAGLPAGLEDAAKATLDHARSAVPARDQAAAAAWPTSAQVELGGARFHVTHATPADPFAGQLDPATCPESELHRLFDDLPADVILLGHTHVPALRQFGQRLIVNPGSLGQPRYGTPDATYAVWEDGHLQVRHLHYDHGAVARRLGLLPLGPEVAGQLTEILETGLA